MSAGDRRAAARLSARACSLFTLSDVVDDLEDVRKELGVERVALMGVSYGTRVALAYAARYPQHVDLLVLDSVVPLSGPAALRLNSFAAVDRVLGEVCAAGCPFAADPTAELAELVGRLAAGPLVGQVARGDGRLHTRAPRALRPLQLSADCRLPAGAASALPRGRALGSRRRSPRRCCASVRSPRSARSARTRASSASPSSSRRPAQRRRRPGSATRRPRSVRRLLVSYADQVPSELFAPFDRETAFAASDLVVCRSWPTGTGRAVRIDAPLPDVPTLIVAGTADLRTPVEDAVALARLLPRAQLLRVKGTGHGAMFQGLPCVERALVRFLAGRPAGGCSVAAARAVRPVVDPRRKVPTFAAVQLTLDDVLEQLRLTLYTKSSFQDRGLRASSSGPVACGADATRPRCTA